MKTKKIHNFTIIGLGMVGTAIGYLLKRSGHRIVAIYDKSPAALKRALPFTGGQAFRNPRDAVVKADTILITVPDDAILSACNEIACAELLRKKFVFHMSGAGGLDLLDEAKRAGAAVASIHPVQSFSSIDNAIQNIPGSFFGITADKEAKTQATIIVRDLRGIPIIISPDQKPLYHAAACIASNYLVSLVNVVESIYTAIGISKKNARKAFLPLIKGTLKNIEISGCVNALTGPIARGDAGTIKKHIAAIEEMQPQYTSLYSVLGLVTVNIAQKKGTLSARQAKIINDLLKGAIGYEHSK
jgi:predicted short-subunit dehydrogenase-like oxidoreductase (DUF2520 family)